MKHQLWLDGKYECEFELPAKIQVGDKLMVSSRRFCVPGSEPMRIEAKVDEVLLDLGDAVYYVKANSLDEGLSDRCHVFPSGETE
jgi:hypothetical protein